MNTDRIAKAPVCRYATTTSIPAEGVLAALTFGARPPVNTASIPLIHVPLPTLGDSNLVEVWTTNEPIKRSERDGIRYAATESVLFGWAEAEPRNLAEGIRDLYRRFFSAMRDTEFPHLLRAWNYIPSINAPDEKGMERYRTFCVGRHGAFSEIDPLFERNLPAASAVGSTARNCLVYAIAARQPGLQIENPLQVSAFRYPLQYGPRSPSFSRALLKRWSDRQQLFISGTASITGHQTVNAGNLRAQMDKIRENLDALLQRAGEHCDVGTTFAPQLLKVYVRQPEHYEELSAQVGQWWPDARVSYLQADICRENLLVEIEAIAHAA